MIGHNPIILQKLVSIKAYLNLIENYGGDRRLFTDSLKNIKEIVDDLLGSEHPLHWKQGVPQKPGLYYFSPTTNDVDIPMLVGVSTVESSNGSKELTVRHIQAYDFDPFEFPGIENVIIRSITQVSTKNPSEVYYYVNDLHKKQWLVGSHPLSKCWFAGPIERPPRSI